MNEEEREIVKKFERLYLKDFNNEKITNEDRLSYIECALITNLIEKLQKENEELENSNKYLRERESYLEQRQADIIYDFQNKKTAITIPIQKVKDKIEEEKLPLTIVGGRKNKKTLEYGIKLGRKQALQELIEESEEK